ncbi:MAG: cadmium-translocating P-type ATPase [candidate division Zixibacteria bacterium]|nr:cadmium-translocating P-type ATPase [candidate division Zixibacteria bacterium]
MTNSRSDLHIEGMDCADCASRLERELSSLQGVNAAKVDFVSGKASIEYDSEAVELAAIEKAIRKSGFDSAVSDNQTFEFRVEGMDCSEEGKVIEKALKKLPNTGNIHFDYLNQVVKVKSSANYKDLIDVIKSTGFEPEPVTPSKSEPTKKKSNPLPTIISGILALSGILLTNLGAPEYVYIPILTVAIVMGGYRIARKGIGAASRLSLDMNFLMTIAVIGAIAIGEWSEGAMVIFLFSLSHYLEGKSMERARNAISRLMTLTPKTTSVIRDGIVDSVPVEEVSTDSIIIVKPGESVPLDGVVVEGTSDLNQAPITGESVPVMKDEGDEVFAGSINGNGVLKVRTIRPYKDSTVSRIIHLVEEAQSRRAPVQLFVDKFAKYYTPIVVISAVLIAAIPPLFFDTVFSEWFYRALVLLVIACPCALVISTPVAFVSGLTAAARNGILIKGGSYLERAAKIDTFAFDKTGTITYGKPKLVDIISLSNAGEKEILSVAASLERNSEHPLARAIVDRAEEGDAKFQDVREFSAIPGMGVKGTIDGTRYYLANHTFFEKNGLCDGSVHDKLSEMEHSSQTVILLGAEDKLLGLLSVTDMIRTESGRAIAGLKKLGIKETLMVSGDNHRTTEAVSKAIGSDSFYSELMPEHKMELIRNRIRNGSKVAMIGDGINDAPALAAADIGISMGIGGTDVALETADIAVVGDDLDNLPILIRLARKTLGIIKQNITLALGIKAVFVILTLLGQATLWMAVFADMGASLIVTSNSLRILKSRYRD